MTDKLNDRSSGARPGEQRDAEGPTTNMAGRYRLLAVDLDGTLWTRRTASHPRTAPPCIAPTKLEWSSA